MGLDTQVLQPSVGDAIRRRSSAIVDSWERAVRSLPPAGDLPIPLVRDEVPDVLRRIADLVDHADRQTVRKAEGVSECHAWQRLGVGFELAHVLMEYSILRNSILEQIGQEIALTVPTLLTLNRAIDTVANASVDNFATANQRLMNAIDQVSSEAFGSRSLDDLLDRLTTVLMQASPAVDSVAVLLIGEDGRLRTQAAKGLIAGRSRDFSLKVGDGFAGAIAATLEPRHTRSACTDPAVHSDFFRQSRVLGLYGVPLVDLDCIGVAHMGSTTVHDFTPEEKLLFGAMAARASAAIVQAQLRDKEREARDEARDVHQELAREHRLLLSVVGQMPPGVIVTDARGTIVAANRALVGLLGKDPTGTDVRELTLRGAGAAQATRSISLLRALASGEVVRAESITVSTEDGRELTLQASVAPVVDDDGDRIAAVMVLQDITQRIRDEQERDLYLGTISHDLRNPLAVIKLTADALLRRGDLKGAAVARNLGRIAYTAERLERLISQLMDFARSRHGGGFVLERSHTELPAICRQVIDAFEVTHAPRTITLEAEGPCVGEWDRDRLTQLVQNLISNALEHGKKRGLICIRLYGGPASTLLEVRSENAAGAIPPAMLAKIFDPFSKGRNAKGFGLGLYICREIARAHGTDIEVHSSAAETVFAVRLPAQPAPAARPLP
jgi:PAS domain S-box-containing protein